MTHFIGLGGIGMSALAKVLLEKGESVQGSDLSSSSLLKELEELGAKVFIGHEKKRLHQVHTVVYSSGIKKDNVEFLEAKEKGVSLLHRSELLDFLMRGKTKLLVTGTHGKTTTSALLSHVLYFANKDPSFVLGGIVQSLKTNGHFGQGSHFVCEADESDGSFLKTKADFAILTNFAEDHLDYWKSPLELKKGFQQFVDQTETLFWCCDDPGLRSLNMKGSSYGFLKEADWRISSYSQGGQGIVFDLNDFRAIEAGLFGRHNTQNAAAVFALCYEIGIPEALIRAAFQSFKGTARRFEKKGEVLSVEVFDDYAHHPNEIKATLKAMRDHVKEKRLVVAFQPHRFSRLRACFEEFLEAFDLVDFLFLTEVYSAGECPDEDFLEDTFFQRLQSRLGDRVKKVDRLQLEKEIASFLRPHDAFLTMGAGDITKAGPLILAEYEKRGPKLSVALLCGGKSPEHDVSLMSAKNILDGLDKALYELHLFKITKAGKWQRGFSLEEKEEELFSILAEIKSADICIPVFHGPYGEDGMIASFLETLQVPYVGCDYQSAAVCMQKIWSKQIVSNYNIPVVPYFEIRKEDYSLSVLDEVEALFPYPIWVKPVHLGSSIGVSMAEDREGLKKAIEYAFLYDTTLVLEKNIIGKQVEFAFLGNRYIEKGMPSEIVSGGNFVGFHDKYGPSAMKIEVPAQISEHLKKLGLELAETVYKALGCKGLARIDFFLTPEGYYWFNEINPFPGFTDTSAYPKMLEEIMGGKRPLLDRLIISGLEAFRGKR